MKYQLRGSVPSSTIMNIAMVTLLLIIATLVFLIALPPASADTGAENLAAGGAESELRAVPIPPGVATTAPAGPAEIFPELAVLKKSYPDVTFDVTWAAEQGDWKILLSAEGRTSTLYYAGGRFLSLVELPRVENYRVLMYRFPSSTTDPATLSPGALSRMQNAGATSTRRNAATTSTTLFDAIYHTATQAAAEEQLALSTFLGKGLRVHRRIKAPLAAVEARIKALAASDNSAQLFIETLDSADGFNWRQIRDTSGRSFHSMGLAIDLLPRNAESKTLYWNWRKQKVGDAWPLTALDERWSPGEAVIGAFEAEGFIWGGRWAFWDNMHFEYRPELIAARELFQD